MRRNRIKRKSFNYGSLEPRKMLAGNVNANVNGDHIFVRGDQQDNQIRIHALDTGQIRVSGMNQTTVNGRAFVIVENSSGIFGSARVGSEYAGGIRVHMGPGNDTINVDGIRLNDYSIIYGGTGDDVVNISSTEFTNSFLVQTFTGNDDISIQNTEVVDTLFALSLEGTDSITIGNLSTRGGAILATGADDDTLSIASSEFLGARQFALTQDGDDSVEINNVSLGTGSLEFYTGNGDDEVEGDFFGGNIDGNVIIAGQNGTDFGRMNIPPNIANQFSIRGFEFNGEVIFENARDIDTGFTAFSKPNDSFFVADFVEFQQTTRISSIEWLGSYEFSNAPAEGDQFVVEIYESGTVSNDLFGEYQSPVGPPRATFNVGNANRQDTGLTWTRLGTTRKVFNFSADIDFQMDPNTQYWISIYSMPIADLNNDFYILAEDIEDQLDGSNNGAALIRTPNFPDWLPNTSGKTHFTLRS